MTVINFEKKTKERKTKIQIAERMMDLISKNQFSSNELHNLTKCFMGYVKKGE